MINEYDLKHLRFDLNETKPVQVILRNHQDLSDSYFDMHYAFEIGILISGRMQREYFDYQTVITPGDVWFCGMWEPHGFSLLESPCELVVLVVDPKYLLQHTFLSHHTAAPFQVPPKLRPTATAKNKHEIVALAQKIKTQCENTAHNDWAKLYLFQLLLTLIEDWETPVEVEDIALKENIQNALKLVFNKKRRISNEEAAAACHMSVSKFRRTFKSLMQCSFSDFSLKYRIRGAMAQLKKSNETQEAVALYWGFTDASHLHKYIKKFE